MVPFGVTLYLSGIRILVFGMPNKGPQIGQLRVDIGILLVVQYSP